MGTFKGNEQLVGFWNADTNSCHDGIHELLHLRSFLAIEDRLAVELEFEWRCLKDTDYLGPRKANDVFWGHCVASNTLHHDELVRAFIYLNLPESDDKAN